MTFLQLARGVGDQQLIRLLKHRRRRHQIQCRQFLDRIFGFEFTERKEAFHDVVIVSLFQLLDRDQFRHRIQLLHAAGIAQIDHRQQLAAANDGESLRQQKQIDSIDRFLMRENDSDRSR